MDDNFKDREITRLKCEQVMIINEYKKICARLGSLEGKLEEMNDKFTDYYDGVCADIRILHGVVKPRQELELENNNIYIKLEELQKQIHEIRIQFINQLGNNNRPQNCPACQGWGKREHAIVNIVECNACEGKGIVWG